MILHRCTALAACAALPGRFFCRLPVCQNWRNHASFTRLTNRAPTYIEWPHQALRVAYRAPHSLFLGPGPICARSAVDTRHAWRGGCTMGATTHAEKMSRWPQTHFR
jgi:hypothetical protein